MIPLFIYASIALVYMLQVIAVKMKVNDALYNSVREYAQYSFIKEEINQKGEGNKAAVIQGSEESSLVSQIVQGSVSTATLKVLLINELGNDFAVDNNIVGGNLGWDLSKSQLSGDKSDVQVVLKYTIKNPIDIFGISYITVTEKKGTEKWTGAENDSFKTSAKDSDDKELVYITEEGEVYHKTRYCTYLTRLVETCEISGIDSKRNNSGGKYYICTRCKKISKTVYYTKYGNRFHTDTTCSELSRFIIAVDINSVKNRRACSKCYS